MPASMSLLEPSEQMSRPQKRGREEVDNEGGEGDKCWNCTRRRVECVWPR